MQYSKSVLIVIFLSLLHISPANSQDKKPPNNWVKFCPSSQLCFDRPLDLIPADLPIIDSIAGQLTNENMTLYYDLGRYSTTFKELSETTSEAFEVDGYQGKILIQQKKMALTIPAISGELGFSMLIEFKNTLDLEQGRIIFNSVKFNL